MKTETYILPAYWASYLINNDDSGTSIEDIKEADKFLNDNNLPSPVSIGEETWFAWSNDANNIGGDVAEYIFYV